MPGSGKTTVGKLLAERSGKSFVDLDEEIARRAGMSIPEMFASQGEGPFRQLEHEVLTEACAKSGQIIATGGGAVLREEKSATSVRPGRRRRSTGAPSIWGHMPTGVVLMRTSAPPWRSGRVPPL